MKSILIVVITLFTSIGRGEPETNNFLQSGGDVQLTAFGGLVVPPYVYKSLDQGQMSPVLQLVLHQHLMAECVEEVLKEIPTQKTPFAKAHGAFSNGVCRLSKCFQQSMVLDHLAQSSNKKSTNGNQSDPQAQKASGDIALLLYQASAKTGCDEKGNSDAGSPSENVDKELLRFLQH